MGKCLVLGHPREVDEVDPGLLGHLGEAERARLGLLGQDDLILREAGLPVVRDPHPRRDDGLGSSRRHPAEATAGAVAPPAVGSGVPAQPARPRFIPTMRHCRAFVVPSHVRRLMRNPSRRSGNSATTPPRKTGKMGMMCVTIPGRPRCGCASRTIEPAGPGVRRAPRSECGGQGCRPYPPEEGVARGVTGSPLTFLPQRARPCRDGGTTAAVAIDSRSADSRRLRRPYLFA